MGSRTNTILWFLLGVSLTAAIALGVVVLTGDDDGSGGTAATTEATTTTTATTTTDGVTTTAAPTTTAATTTSSAPAPACAGLPSVATPVMGPGVSVVMGDFDADGAMDQFFGYEAAGTFRVQIALSYGYATEITTIDAAEALAAQPFAEGDAWLGLAKTSFGASTDVVQWFMLDGCTIVPVTVDGTFEASFIKGGGVMHMDGMICNPSSFTTTSAQTSNGTNWEYFTTDYTWDPVARTFINSGIASSTLTSPADDAVIFTAAAFVCPFAP